jgi:uncharacterized protein (TIGR03435 family)
VIDNAIANHLWQSTLFAAAAWGVTLGLGRNRASIRHAVWLAASVKFLVPFSWVALLGGGLAQMRAAAPAMAASGAIAAIEKIGEPFAPALPGRRGSPPKRAPFPISDAALAIWACGSFAVASLEIRRWMRIRALVRRGQPIGFDIGVPAVSVKGAREPGVFGLFAPVLALPEGIEERLSQEQLKAILAHELCHVRRRDNLTAAVQMAVEAAFWFHPLVWFVGARLVDERERACDEDVVRAGNDPEVYAESILRACRFYLESPVACVSGVTGGKLAGRIERIMATDAARALGVTRRLSLAALGAAAVVVPLAYGVLDAPLLRAYPQSSTAAPKVEVATIKPSKSGERGYSIIPSPGGHLRTGNTSLRRLLLIAFHLHDVQLEGGPDWMDRDRFDIDVKAEGSPKLNEDQMRAMLGALVIERFHLETHRETRQIAVYSLVPGKTGPKMAKSDKDEGPSIRNRRVIDAKGGTMPQLADLLGWVMGRPVLDRTGLAGNYVYHLEWIPDESQIQGELTTGPPAELDPNGESIFTAVQAQLGLKLEAGRGPVEILVVDRAVKPAEN